MLKEEFQEIYKLKPAYAGFFYGRDLSNIIDKILNSICFYNLFCFNKMVYQNLKQG